MFDVTHTSRKISRVLRASVPSALFKNTSFSLPPPPPDSQGAKLMRAAPRKPAPYLIRGLPAYLLPALALLALAAALLWLQPADPARAQDEPSGPTITAGPTITSSPQSGDTYRQGEAIAVALTFSEPVTVNGKPRIRLKIGDQKRWAGYAHSSEDGATLSFSHAVKADDQDADGIAIGKNQLKLNKGSIADADGNPANLKHPALPDQAAHKVNGAPDEPAQPEPEPTPTPTPEPANNAPQFASDTATRSVEENTPAGARVGARVTATDPDGATDSIEVTISVVNVDEPGVVRLSTDTPQAGSALIATVTDPDGIVEGSVAWQWKRSPDGTTADNVDVTDFNDIAGATSASIQLTDADDAGRWLRALAIYTDAFGKTKARAQTANPVAPDPNRPAPQFADATATRSVDENTPAGTSVGAPVVATDEDDDTLTYALTGSDAFSIDASGQITVASGADLDYETQASYTVTVTVHDGKNAQGEADSGVDDSIAVTISVVNVDEAGQVFLNTMEPQVGVSLSALVFDPDGGVSGEIWTWESSAYGSEWTAIAGATDAAYTPVDGDAGRYLRASASYADAQGPGKSARSDAAGPVTGVSRQILANAAPQFADATAARSVDENTPAGTSVGAPVVATDEDDDTLTYELTGSDAFTIDGSGQVAVASGADLDYETQATHTITVSVHDGKNAQGEADTSVDDTVAVTISVVNVNEPGVVSLSLDQPIAGSELTATVLDPDGITAGSVVWQWKRSPDGTTADNVDTTDFPNIAGATSPSILLTEADDAGRWLRALAIYTDAFGSGQRARAQTANPALAQPPAPSVTAGPILNSPASGGVYGAGEEIVVSLTFSAPVTVSGQPRLGLVIGDAARWATYGQSSQDGATLSFTYTVQTDDKDDDGLSVTANSLELNGGTITGDNGVAADLPHPGVANLTTHKVNGSGAVAQPQFGLDPWADVRDTEENFNTYMVPYTPVLGDFKATPLKGGNKVKLSWTTESSWCKGSDIPYTVCTYFWQLRKKGDEWPKNLLDPDKLLWGQHTQWDGENLSSITVEVPTRKATYEVRVFIGEYASEDTVFYLGLSPTTEFTTAIPNPVERVRANPGYTGSEMELRWGFPDACITKGEPICEYMWKHREQGGTYPNDWNFSLGTFASGQYPVRVTGLSPETTYEFLVRIRLKSDNSEFGEGTATATTLTKPEVEVEAGHTSMRVRWTGVAKLNLSRCNGYRCHHSFYRGWLDPVNGEPHVYRNVGALEGRSYTAIYRQKGGTEWTSARPNMVRNVPNAARRCIAGTPSDLPFDTSTGLVNANIDSANGCGGRDGKWAWSWTAGDLKPNTTYQVQVRFVISSQGRSYEYLLGETEVTTDPGPQ